MKCRICLTYSEKMLDIFECEDIQNISSIISEHFWFEPVADDPISRKICRSCWNKIKDFHEFYIIVKKTHEQLSNFCDKRGKECIEISTYLGEEEVLYDIEDLESRKSVSTGDSNTKGKNSSQVTLCKTKKEDRRLTLSKQQNDHNFDSEIINKKPQFPEIISLIEETQETCELVKPLTVVGDDLNDDYKSTKIANDLKIISSNEPKKQTISNSCSKRKLGNKDKLESENSKNEQRLSLDDEKIAKYMKLKCDICSMEYTTFADIRRHYRACHMRKGYVVCCNKKLSKRVLILDHIKKHLNPDYFKCDQCNKVFSDKQCLKNHMIKHVSEDTKNFTCEQCPRRFVKQYLLDRHRLNHTPQEERKFLCSQCGKAFPSSNLLQTHQKLVHDNIYSQICHICAKVVRGKTLFEKHQLEHAGVVQPKVQCQKCGAWLKHEYSLKKHMARHCDEFIKYVCEKCGKEAPTKGALQSHIRYVHALERTFECHVCKKAFKKALTLKEHMTTHTGEVLYTCPYCPKNFNSSANLHSHRKKVHRKQWEEDRKNRGIPTDIVDNTKSNLLTSKICKTLTKNSTLIKLDMVNEVKLPISS